MSIVAITSLIASFLVLASVVTANRQRQLQEAAVLHAIGSRRSSLIKALGIEYVLLGVVVAMFASIVGAVLGTLVASMWLELPVDIVSWVSGSAVALVLRCLVWALAQFGLRVH